MTMKIAALVNVQSAVALASAVNFLLNAVVASEAKPTSAVTATILEVARAVLKNIVSTTSAVSMPIVEATPQNAVV